MGNKSKNSSGKPWKRARNMAAASMPNPRAPRRTGMQADTVRVASGSTDWPKRTVEVFAPSSVFHSSTHLGTYRRG